MVQAFRLGQKLLVGSVVNPFRRTSCIAPVLYPYCSCMIRTLLESFKMSLPKSLDSWVRIHKRSARARFRLFCFGHAGSGPAFFHSWSDAFPEDIELCCIQLPGREARIGEEPFTRLRPIIDTLGETLIPYLGIDFAFFGCSMGGLIGFELARHLRRRQMPSPAHLFIAGCPAPQLWPRRLPSHGLPDSAFLSKLRDLNGTPEAILDNSELMQLLLRMLRADLAVCETYVYLTDAPLDCPISVYGGLRDLEVSADDLAAWRVHTTSAFKKNAFLGDHFFLQSDRALVLRTLNQELSAASRRSLPSY